MWYSIVLLLLGVLPVIVSKFDLHY